jgi:hypothetical protein
MLHESLQQMIALLKMKETRVVLWASACFANS